MYPYSLSVFYFNQHQERDKVQQKLCEQKYTHIFLASGHRSKFMTDLILV